MQYSSASHNLTFIIFIIFLFTHGVQSYVTGVSTTQAGHWCSGFFHLYVTDCYGTVILDPGFKSCDFPDVLLWWNEAPSHYCVHAYPQTHPQRNRYQEVHDSNSCFGLYGGYEDWSFDPQDMKYCQ
ncbi:hypothetical protein C2G38_2137308 [Gigaspora rosea]|uniref:Uncharacterized protein n=1 Tax=Gigaspora rosea TaxID=44941 RepID=A0A397W5D7_9GLOM|nr:hypothetical protein C2G38_2137308 [Gigaspora rosea]